MAGCHRLLSTLAAGTEEPRRVNETSSERRLYACMGPARTKQYLHNKRDLIQPLLYMIHPLRIICAKEGYSGKGGDRESLKRREAV